MSNDTPQTALEVVHRKVSQSQIVQETTAVLLSDINHDKRWTVLELSRITGLDPKEESCQFLLAMSQVNRNLEEQGYHLTTRGSGQTYYYVEPLECAEKTAQRMTRAAMNSAQRALQFRLGVLRHHADKLTDAQREELQHGYQRDAARFVVMTQIKY